MRSLAAAPAAPSGVRAERLDVPRERVCARKVSAAVRALLRHVAQVALRDVLPEARREHVLAAAPAPRARPAVAVVRHRDVVVLPQVPRDARGRRVLQGYVAAPRPPLAPRLAARGGLVTVQSVVRGQGRVGVARVVLTRRASSVVARVHEARVGGRRRGSPAHDIGAAVHARVEGVSPRMVARGAWEGQRIHVWVGATRASHTGVTEEENSAQ